MNESLYEEDVDHIRGTRDKIHKTNIDTNRKTHKRGHQREKLGTHIKV